MTSVLQRIRGRQVEGLAEAEPSREFPVVQAVGVRKEYGDQTVVRDANFAAEFGQFVLIAGHSGSGKSTLLGMLSGDVRPTSGQVRLFDEDVTTAGGERIKNIKRGFVSGAVQDALLDRSMSVYDNARWVADANGLEVDRSRLASLAVRLGIGDKLFQEAGSLSGGQQMRTALLRTLVVAPNLLILDEPTGPLGDTDKTDVFNLLREEADENGMTVIVGTHDVSFGNGVADVTYMMTDGVLAPAAATSPMRSA